MNTYIAFYKSKRIEVNAETSFQAQTEAAKQFKAKKQHEVMVALVTKNGVPYVHSTSEI